MTQIQLALHAMNTRFELVLSGEDPVALRAAGEDAWREIARIEDLLSAFRPTSEIAHVNARAATEPVRVSPEVFALLTRARALWERTDGAFDITVGSLMRCWGFWGASGRPPEAASVEAATRSTGLQLVDLDATRRTVAFRQPGMALDPGAIGKGYAIDQAVEILRENGVHSALLHGGTSTTYAIGRPAGQSGWRTTLRPTEGAAGGEASSLPTVELVDQAVSVSAVAEKCFTRDGVIYGHVIDPRSGWPVTGAVLAAVASPDATTADALSTALMVLGPAGLPRVRAAQPGVRAWLVDAHGAVHGMASGSAGSDG